MSFNSINRRRFVQLTAGAIAAARFAQATPLGLPLGLTALLRARVLPNDIWAPSSNLQPSATRRSRPPAFTITLPTRSGPPCRRRG